MDPLFDAQRSQIDDLEKTAWSAYEQARKAPITQKAGNEFADPD